MQVSKVNSYSLNQQKPSFKSAIPVVTMLGKTYENASIATTEKLNETFLRKIQYLIDNTLKRGINERRDSFVDRLRACIKSHVSDFDGKVLMYTCVDGGLEEGGFRPFAYMLTGQDKKKIELLREDYKNAVKDSQGYRTAELDIAKDRYYKKGNFLVYSGYENTSIPNIEKPIFFACFLPKLNKKGEIMRTKEGEIRDYIISQVGFIPLDRFQNPQIKVGDKLK